MLHIRPGRTLLIAALFTCLAAGVYAQQGGAVPALAYDAQTRMISL